MPAATLEVQELQSESPLADQESPLAQAESPLGITSDSDAVQAADLDVDVEPTADSAVVVGRLVSLTTNEPLADRVVRLPEVYCPDGITEEQKRDECFWALDDAFTPGDITDEDGIFIIEGVEPRDYVLMIGDVMTRYTVIEDNAERPIIWMPAANDILEVGQIAVDM